METIAAVTLDTNRVISQDWIETRIPKWCDLHVHVIDAPIEHGFATARNYAFAIAALSGAEWGLMLDTDMHYEHIVGPYDMSTVPPGIQAVSLPERSGSYSNDRLFKLPLVGQFVGATHEYYDVPSSYREQGYSPKFWEDDKTNAALEAKARRDIQLLNAELLKDRTNARNLYYRADAYAILGEWDRAITSFNLAAAMTSWQQEAAWSMYRCAEIFDRLGQYRMVRGYCTSAMKFEPMHPESACLAGVASYYLNEYRDAIIWANIAIDTVRTASQHPKWKRSGFRRIQAWYEWPYDILHQSYHALGMYDDSLLNDAIRAMKRADRLRDWS